LPLYSKSFFLFFLMPRPPPNSTVIPYSTLFRSHAARHPHRLDRARRRQGQAALLHQAPAAQVQVPAGPAARGDRQRDAPDGVARAAVRGAAAGRSGMMAGKQVRLFLVDGSAGGLMTAEIGNWTGHVLKGKRPELGAIRKRSEASRTGVYIRFGTGE